MNYGMNKEKKKMEKEKRKRDYFAAEIFLGYLSSPWSPLDLGQLSVLTKLALSPMIWLFDCSHLLLTGMRYYTNCKLSHYRMSCV